MNGMVVKKETIKTGWQEVAGVLLLAGCLLSFLSLISYSWRDIPVFVSPPVQPPGNFIGPAGAWYSFILFMAFGVAAYLVPVAMAFIGLLCLFQREGKLWPRVAWTLAVLMALTLLFDLQPDGFVALRAKLNLTSSGGALGEILAHRLLEPVIGPIGAGILGSALLLAGLIMMIDVHPAILARSAGTWTRGLLEKWDAWRVARRDRIGQIEDEEQELAKRRQRLERAMKKEPVEPKKRPAPEPKAIPEPEVEPPPPSVVVVPEPTPRKTAAKPTPPPPQPEPVLTAHSQSRFKLPPLELLEPIHYDTSPIPSADLNSMGALLKETLADFGVEVEVTAVEQGPVVTRFELLPAPGVKVERISGLSNNIALSMKAESIRVQAPIPGKGVVGIEIPNSSTTTVYLREVLESAPWTSGKAALPLALGKDVGGHVLVADLADMPHMLIAGATGSGKTVCMNSILTGLLASRTPDEMKLMLVDPKIVEFASYNHLPHLVVPVITEAKKVMHGLRWAINEMEKRYKLFAKAGVRNIKGYNSRPIVQQESLFETGEGEETPPGDGLPERVPYIVIVVDELADLMLVAQAEIENSIARLAQLSRAVGIHMILATQRPSVNVITGTIKANFPARISFQVAQKVDSRTILDAPGAEKLLGKGDLLFLPPGSPKLIRAQGTYTTDNDINNVVQFIKDQGTPDYENEVKEKIENQAADIPDMEENDDLLEQAVEIIRQTKRASTSSLQRRLRIGYTRAARVMDILEQKGIVGPAQGAEPREILIDLDGDVPTNSSDV